MPTGTTRFSVLFRLESMQFLFQHLARHKDCMMLAVTQSTIGFDVPLICPAACVASGRLLVSMLLQHPIPAHKALLVDRM